MKIQIKELYRCGQCREVQDDEDGARECCMPEVHTLFQCPVCEATHEDTEEAISCCNIDGITCPSCLRDYSSVTIHYSAIKVSGHCNICNPLFTIEQQLAIQDLHYQETGHREHLHD